jgi:hypothetical protein
MFEIHSIWSLDLTSQNDGLAFHHNVLDLINVLPGNSSVNMVQHTTVEEAVFSVSVVTSHNSG